MKMGEIVDTYYNRTSGGCPICGTSDIDWVSGTWECGFDGSYYTMQDGNMKDVPEGKVLVMSPCKNYVTLAEVNQEPDECDCSGYQLLNFGHKCSFHNA